MTISPELFIHGANGYLKIVAEQCENSPDIADLEVILNDLHNMLQDANSVFENHDLSLEEYADIVCVCKDALEIGTILERVCTQIKTD